MGFTTRVASGLGLKVVQRGSLDLVSAADARRLLLVCEEEEVPVLGLEGFRVEGTAIVPEMAAIADYSSSFRGSADRARETIASACRFLDSMTDSTLLFELVYAIDDETGGFEAPPDCGSSMSIIARRVGESIAANMGCLPEPMSLKQLWAVQARWRSVFAEGLHQASGRWVMEKCDWDVFSRGYFPCLRGENARRAYAEVSPASILYVTSAWARNEFGFVCVGGRLASLVPNLDLLVFDETVSWTMAFTHSDHGPFFALADSRGVDDSAD